jgi:ribokinase
VSKILVAGSYNEDMTVVSQVLPRSGETVLGASFFAAPGGKGANQAIGAARLGADTTFLVKLGLDPFGDRAQRLFIDEGLPAHGILRTAAAPTGVALIMVDVDGANQISVAPGANGLLMGTDALDGLLRDVSVLLCQLECPPELFESLAHRLPSATKILNPAPARPLRDECFGAIDFLTPNESELASLTGLAVTSDAEVRAASSVLIGKGVGNVIATLGANGALWTNGSQERHFPAPAVVAVDSTGAGDAFNAGLAAALALKWSVADAIELAVRCGAFCVTRTGALDGLPRLDDLQLPVRAR